MREKSKYMYVRVLDRHMEKLEQLQRQSGLGRSDIIRLLIDQASEIVIRPVVAQPEASGN